MSANYIILCVQYGIENVDDGTRNVKLKIIFHIFIALSLSLSLSPITVQHTIHIANRSCLNLTELQLPPLAFVQNYFYYITQY